MLGLVLGIVSLLLGIVSLVLGIWALRIGFKHVREIRLVLTDTKAELDSLKTIQDSISTRYLAEFPSFIPEIVKLIGDARSEVTIFCDIPAYGQFSARSDWIKYSQAIQSLNENVKITLTCLNPDRRVAFYREQFLQDTSWEDLKALPVNIERLKQLLLAKHSKVEIESLTEETFVGFLEDTNELMTKTHLASAEVQEIEFFMPAYFWLVDGTHAVFSIPSFTAGHSEYGFITTDQKLIDAFREMRLRFLRRPPVHSRSAPAPE